MLPRNKRISRINFPAPKEHGSRVFSPFFTAVFYKGRIESCASVVVSKKTAKNAVVRNKIRRRFYELLAPYFKTITIPITVVIYPKANTPKTSFSILNKEMEKALKQARVI
ncbi:MAG: ribonuclease P protein component [Minisyncoccia bacterium]